LIYQLVGKKEFILETTINKLKQEFNDIISLTKELFVNKSAETFNKKPNPESWSAAECLAHLNYSAIGYLNNVIGSFSHKYEGNRNQPYKPRLLVSKFIKSVGPDSKIRAKTSSKADFSISVLDHRIVDEFISCQLQFIDLLNRISFQDMKKVKVRSPFVSIIKFQLGEVFLINLFHQLRHLNQAKKAMGQ